MNKYLILLLLLTHHAQISTGQSSVDPNAFRSMTTPQRVQYIRSFKNEWKDTTSFMATYRPLLSVAQAVNDIKTIWNLHYEQFRLLHFLHAEDDQMIEVQNQLLEEAQSYGLDIEAIIAEHHLNFEKYNHQLLSSEYMYAYILHEYERMEAIGFEKFKEYELDRLLYHNGKFMYQLEDFEKALKFLHTAEKYAQPDNNGLQVWMFVYNHIESIYQRQKKYDLSIPYAQKILEIAKNCPGESPYQQQFCKTWQGIACIDLASIYLGQGKYTEGERYANEGYELLKVPLDDNVEQVRAEYDMLQALITSKLELHKLDEAGTLLQRAAKIAPILDQKQASDYFKHLKFYQSYDRYYELKGDFAASVRFSNLAKPLQDSLDRRNDARTLEKIKQRMDAEKYNAQLELMETEKQLQKMLRNAALIILLLVGGLAFANYKRLQHKRLLAETELETAKSKLHTFTQHLREKSEIAENLRLELEKRSLSGERSEYLEQLSRSTILTDKDWAEFRIIFEKVHPDFISQQKNLYPELTQAELRYLALEKLQLTTNEMANMLGVSDGTIRQTRMRMRRKTSEA